MMKGPGYLIFIPQDPKQRVRIIEDGYTVISTNNPLELTLIEYVRRGLRKRLDKQWEGEPDEGENDDQEGAMEETGGKLLLLRPADA